MSNSASFKKATESISQEFLPWALKALKECGCEILAIKVHPKEALMRDITFLMPIVAA